MSETAHGQILTTLYGAFQENAGCAATIKLQRYGEPVRILAGQTEAPPHHGQTEIVVADLSAALGEPSFVIDCFSPNLPKDDWCRWGVGGKRDVYEGSRLKPGKFMPEDYRLVTNAVKYSAFGIDDTYGEIERLSQNGEIGAPRSLRDRLGLLVTRGIVLAPGSMWRHFY